MERITLQGKKLEDFRNEVIRAFTSKLIENEKAFSKIFDDLTSEIKAFIIRLDKEIQEYLLSKEIYTLTFYNFELLLDEEGYETIDEDGERAYDFIKVYP